jgi:hypothetical protein
MSAAIDLDLLGDVYEQKIALLPSQYEFVTAETKHTAFIGGLGSGKTHCGADKLILRALAQQNWDAKGYIGANTYKQLYQATLSTLFEIMDDYGIWYRWKPSSSELFIEDRPAPILCYSLENYNALRGIELGFAWLDETARTKEDAFKVVVGRLRHKTADLTVDITTTPDGFNWLYDKFVTEVEENPDIAELRSLVHASTYENHHLPDEYFYNLEATFDDLLLRQEVDGEFINVFGGRCYRTFQRTTHMTRVIKPNPGFPIDLCLDFNVDPMSSNYSQMIPGGSGPAQINVLGEIVLPFSDTPAVCREFARRFPRWDAGVRVYGDASGKTSGATTGTTDYKIVKELLGKRYRVTIDVPNANPPVVDRVNSVNALFRDRDPGRVDRVVCEISKGAAPKLVKDLEQVAFKEGTRDIEKKDPELTHSSDAFGYYVYRVARLGRYTGPPVRTVAARNR